MGALHPPLIPSFASILSAEDYKVNYPVSNYRYLSESEIQVCPLWLIRMPALALSVF
jgi:hypothetical protein